MYYVIIDLEWNNAYSRKHNGFVNEIIEIGAVLADDALHSIDTFSVLIRSQLGKKLSSRVKKLTNISNEDLKSGISLQKALKEFKKWIGGRDCVFLSWGNSDVRTLIDNYKLFLDRDTVPFLTKYADAQKYCQDAMGLGNANQIGLSAAAQTLGVDLERYETHRALGDCRLCLKCLRRCIAAYGNAAVSDYIMDCDDSFYRRLAFKVHNITNLHNPRLDRSALRCVCGACAGEAVRLSEWKTANQAFRALFYCACCDQLLLSSIRFKATFDGVLVSASQKKVERKQA